MTRIVLALFFAAFTLPALAGAAVPTPYSAVYSAAYRGIDGGYVHFTLRPDGGDRFVFESRAEPTLLARFFVTEKGVERSVMRIDETGVRPLKWFSEDGKSGDKRDGALEFVWDQNIVRGFMEGKRVALPTESGIQDRLSIQVAVMTALLRGEDPGTIPMVADDHIKRYTYTRGRSGRMATRAGEFNTVMYQSTRPGSDRISRVWYAPDLGYVPIRAEQLRKGTLETVVELVRLDRSQTARK